MTDADARDYFKAIADMLRDLQVEWVLTQVMDEVKEGKTKPKHISVTSEPSSGTKGSRTKFLSTQPYTTKEQLELLIVAIERAVVATTAIQAAFFELVGQGPTAVRFVEETEQEPAHEYSAPALQQQRSVTDLVEVLKELHAEVRA
jgi:hypothetical protein